MSLSPIFRLSSFLLTETGSQDRLYMEGANILVFIRKGVYRTSGVIFFHRLLHSYTRHIERVNRGERDIVPSTQDWGHAYVAWGKCASQAKQAGVTLSWHPPPSSRTCKQANFQWFWEKAAKTYDSLFLETQKWRGWNRTAFVILYKLEWKW